MCEQPGVREAVAMTYKLEQIWMNSAAAAASDSSDDDDEFGKSALYRYVGTREGVYRVYPAIRVPLKYDPTQQPWSVECNSLLSRNAYETVFELIRSSELNGFCFTLCLKKTSDTCYI